MYKFRLHFILANSSSLGIQDTNWRLEEPNGTFVTLKSIDASKNINTSKEFLLIGESFHTKDDALISGNHYRDALQSTLIHFRKGANLGDEKDLGGFSDYLKNLIFTKSGLIFINDYIGLHVYNDDFTVCYTSTSPITLSLVLSENDFQKIFKQRLAEPIYYSPKEKLAISLFNDSFFESSKETRFLLLVMAIEALLEFKPRSKEAFELVQRFITEVNDHPSLSKAEKESIIGSLSWIKNESISKTGRDLATRILGDSVYMDRKPGEFFIFCYNLRSQLVHGTENRKYFDQLGNIVATLEVFVADLLDKIISTRVM